jgi:hypothetical protein
MKMKGAKALFPNENQRHTNYYRYAGIKVSRSSV